MLQCAFRQKNKTGKRNDIMAESLFNKTWEEQNSKICGKKYWESTFNNKKVSKCTVESGNLLSALVKQILKGNNSLYLCNS